MMEQIQNGIELGMGEFIMKHNKIGKRMIHPKK